MNDYDCIPCHTEEIANYESDFIESLFDALNDKSCVFGCFFDIDKMKGNE